MILKYFPIVSNVKFHSGGDHFWFPIDIKNRNFVMDHPMYIPVKIVLNGSVVTEQNKRFLPWYNSIRYEQFWKFRYSKSTTDLISHLELPNETKIMQNAK